MGRAPSGEILPAHQAAPSWTNGHCEAFIGTMQRECLYARPLTSEAERERTIADWLAFYNSARPHTALGGLSPVTWLARRA